MLLTALPPPPPTPNTVMRGFSSVMSGFLQIDRHCPRPLPFLPLAAAAATGCCPRFLLETVPEPLTHALECAARTGHARHARRLCPGCVRSPRPADRSAGRPPPRRPGPWPLPAGRRRRAGGRCGRCARECGAPPRQAGKLARPAGQHDALADRVAEAGRAEPVADELQRLVDAGADDARHRRARHLLRQRRCRRRRSAAR